MNRAHGHRSALVGHPGVVQAPASPTRTPAAAFSTADGTCSEVWRWDSAEQMQAALADMPRFGAQAGAAWSLTRDATHLDGETVDER